MVARGTRWRGFVDAVWCLGALISVVILLAHSYRFDAIDLTRRSPFDNTGSGHAEQWIFLEEASRQVPEGASFTVVAPDRDTEMSLFMMAVGLVPESSPVPSSYYGQSTGRGDLAEFVLRFGESGSLPPSEIPVASISGGRVTQRRTRDP